jgi:hypothetical protein
MPDPVTDSNDPVSAAADHAVDDIFGAAGDSLLDDVDDDDDDKPQPAAEGTETPAEDTTGDTTDPAAEDGSAETATDVEDTQAGGAEGETAPAPARPAAPTAPAAPQQPSADDLAAAETAAAAARQRAAGHEKWRAEFTAAREKLRAGKLDPIDDAEEYQRTLAVVAEGVEYLQQGLADVSAGQRQVVARQEVDAFWERFSGEHGVPGDRARAVWEAEVHAAHQKYGGQGEAAVRAVANERFEAKLAELKVQPAVATPPKAAAPKPAVAAPAAPARRTPPVTKGGAKVVPGGASTNRPPRPRAKTEDEEFDEAVGSGVLDFLT